MKKLLFGLVAIIMLSVTGNAQNTAKFEDYKIFGKLHNESLDYFYNNKIKSINTNQNNVEILEVIKKSVSEYSSNNEYLKTTPTEIKNSYTTLLNNYFNGTLKIDTSINSKFSISFQKDYNSTQKAYMIKILDFKSDDYLTYQSYISKLMTELENDKNLSDNDKNIIYISASIGYSSSEYWAMNIDKWDLALTSKIAPRPKAFWTGFLNADVQGAIGGGFAGAGAGAVIVPVIGSIPGWVAGAVGGGSVSSIAWGVAEILFPSEP